MLTFEWGGEPLVHPRIVDIAPTILAAFGVDPPEYMDGQALPFDEG